MISIALTFILYNNQYELLHINRIVFQSAWYKCEACSMDWRGHGVRNPIVGQNKAISYLKTKDAEQAKKYNLLYLLLRGVDVIS